MGKNEENVIINKKGNEKMQRIRRKEYDENITKIKRKFFKNAKKTKKRL